MSEQGCGRDSPFPFQLRRDVFEAMDAVAMRAEFYKLRAGEGAVSDDAMGAWVEWLADRVLNVVQTIKDANVTYGIVDPEKEGVEMIVTPMMVERDAVVGALDAR